MENEGAAVIDWPPHFLERFFMGALVIKRFLKTAALLGSDNDHERLAAARQGTAMLREAGLDWTEVLQAGLNSLGHGAEPVPGQRSTVANAFEDIFKDLFTRVAPKASPAASSAQPTTPEADDPAPTPKGNGVHEIFEDALNGFKSFRSSDTGSPAGDAMNRAAPPRARFRRREAPAASRQVSGPDIPFRCFGVPVLIDQRTQKTPMIVFQLRAGEVTYGPLVAFEQLEALAAAIDLKTPVSGYVSQPSNLTHMPKFKLSLLPV